MTKVNVKVCWYTHVTVEVEGDISLEDLVGKAKHIALAELKEEMGLMQTMEADRLVAVGKFEPVNDFDY